MINFYHTYDNPIWKANRSFFWCPRKVMTMTMTMTMTKYARLRWGGAAGRRGGDEILVYIREKCIQNSEM